VNALHVRAFSVTLQLTEEAIDRIESLLVTPPTGVMRYVVDDFGPDERQRILLLRGQVWEAVVDAAEQLQTERAERSLRRTIRGEAATVWATLQETTSQRLRGYGPLSPDDGARSDVLLDEISRRVTAIFRLVEAAHGDAPTTSPATDVGRGGQQ
jgi:hypothetical protein